MSQQVPHSQLAYAVLAQRLEFCDIAIEISQQYSSWHLKFPFPHLSQHWLSLTRHALLYYLLKHMAWIFIELQPHWLINHSHAMKQQYTKIILDHEEDFDFKLTIVVKTVAWYIGDHVDRILADFELENDIYRLVVHNILGIAVEPFAYRSLLKIYSSFSNVQKQRELPKEENFFDLASFSKLKHQKMISRRHAKRHIVGNILENLHRKSHLEDIRSVLKENLYVRKPIRPRTPKFSINQLRKFQCEGKDENLSNQRQTVCQKMAENGPRKQKKALQSNQLSNAFELNSSLKLKNIKNFPIQRSAAKLQPLGHSFYIINKSNDKKIEINRDQNRTKNQNKIGVQSVKNWTEIINGMKTELCTGNHKKPHKQEKQFHKYDQQFDKPTPKLQTKTPPQKPVLNLNTNNENVQFRKLNLIQSPKVVILDQSSSKVLPLVTKGHSLFHRQMQQQLHRQFQSNMKHHSRLHL